MADLISVTVEGTDSADDLRSLRQWLVEDDRLRGRVRLAEAPPAPGTLGALLDTLTVTLGPGGVATAVASVLISWVRRQRGNVSVKVTRPDGTTAEFSATHVSGLEAPEVRRLAAEFSRSLDQAPGPAAEPGRTHAAGPTGPQPSPGPGAGAGSDGSRGDHDDEQAAR
ncbi:hypothetical protein AB0O91_28595 [Kitasatospora sp. NPDC089797]|uniref:effector-associated constant component EACC1 n=1 Tax=Kitasatospora sp. NPDC089797 TaxID=3155298 RepID=UPI003446397A